MEYTRILWVEFFSEFIFSVLVKNHSYIWSENCVSNDKTKTWIKIEIKTIKNKKISKRYPKMDNKVIQEMT